MKSARITIVLAAAAVGAVVYFAILRPRDRAESEEEHLRAASHPVVGVVVAARATRAMDLTLPAAIQAFQDTPIYARTTGYIAKWYVDIGDRVKAGQVLALIDTPDLDQQLLQMRAALGQAQANLELSRISAQRWKDLIAQNAVAQQDVDQKIADYAAQQANTKAAQANVDRLEQLQGYQKLIAPYDGVVSARNAQIGALISPGAGTEIFHITQTDTLRVFVNVPQSYVRSISPGLKVDVLVPEFPTRTFEGKVTRFAGALDAASRTLLTEIQIPNAKGELYPGMFGQVRFHLKPAEPAIILPSNAAIIRADGTLVATVDASNHIRLLHVKLGRDFGTQIEILDGLPDGARVVSNPSDSLTEGLEVEIAPPSKAP